MFYVHLVAGLASTGILLWELGPDGSRGWAFAAGVSAIVNLLAVGYYA